MNLAGSAQGIKTMTRYTRNAKEVLRDGKHFADCIDDSAARLIADALNERRGMSSAQQSLPLDGADGPLFGRATTLHTIRQENDEYACMCGMRWDVAEGEDHP